MNVIKPKSMEVKVNKQLKCNSDGIKTPCIPFHYTWDHEGIPSHSTTPPITLNHRLSISSLPISRHLTSLSLNIPFNEMNLKWNELSKWLSNQLSLNNQFSFNLTITDTQGPITPHPHQPFLNTIFTATLLNPTLLAMMDDWREVVGLTAVHAHQLIQTRAKHSPSQPFHNSIIKTVNHLMSTDHESTVLQYPMNHLLLDECKKHILTEIIPFFLQFPVLSYLVHDTVCPVIFNDGLMLWLREVLSVMMSRGLKSISIRNLPVDSDVEKTKESMLSIPGYSTSNYYLFFHQLIQLKGELIQQYGIIPTVRFIVLRRGKDGNIVRYSSLAHAVYDEYLEWNDRMLLVMYGMRRVFGNGSVPFDRREKRMECLELFFMDQTTE